MRAVTSSLFAAAVVAALLAGCAQTISPDNSLYAEYRAR